MTDVETLVDSHTRAELDQIASEAGVDNPESLDSKTAVAEAIVAAEPETAAAEEAAPEAVTTESSGLPQGWQIVQNGPDYFTAERYVESLGLQKVSEGAASLEELVAACEAYDAHQDALAPGWPNQAVVLTGVGSENP